MHMELIYIKFQKESPIEVEQCFDRIHGFVGYYFQLVFFFCVCFCFDVQRSMHYIYNITGKTLDAIVFLVKAFKEQRKNKVYRFNYVVISLVLLLLVPKGYLNRDFVLLYRYVNPANCCYNANKKNEQCPRLEKNVLPVKPQHCITAR